MKNISLLVITFYDRLILRRPRLILTLLISLLVFLGYYAKDFQLDASTETLILEHDEDLKLTQQISARYNMRDFLILTYTPVDNLFSELSLSRLRQLRDELMQLEGVSSVVSILDVPLLESPPVTLQALSSNIRTLDSPDVDLSLAKKEFANGFLYKKLLASPDLKTTAVLIYLEEDERYQSLLTQRNRLFDERQENPLTAEAQAEYQRVLTLFESHRDKARQLRHHTIVSIRKTMDRYRDRANLFLGGVSMVSDDMISFIKGDIKVFGVGVFLFLIMMLGIIFRRVRWILLPMLCCVYSAILMFGLLGKMDWEVTVVSSNFISLQLIMTMAISIHLIVRYRELIRKSPQEDHRSLVLNTTLSMLRPCLYTALTTIAGFGSLVLCDILPVINFGWMMLTGVTISMLTSFLLFPTVLILLNKKPPTSEMAYQFSITAILAKFTEAHGTFIIAASVVAFLASGLGISQLVVENRFIDYFKDTTEIHQGMKAIDQELGGTIPLDIIVDLSDHNLPSKPDTTNPTSDHSTDPSDPFAEFAEFEETDAGEKYWFTPSKMEMVEQIHGYLERLPELGKVLSLGTLLQLGKKLNGGIPLENFTLALLYGEMPKRYRDTLITPYVSIEHDQVRFSVRVIDSMKSLNRNKLLEKIRNDIIDKFEVNEKKIRLTGLMVLYNNMLQSLFRSQILTLGVTMGGVTMMFLVLFKSLKIALVAIFPNLLSISMMLGFMGWMGIPLDIMTMTIAAISVGIAVDDTIHYIHRFQHEFKRDRDYHRSMYRCHDSIAYAMYYTSITIIAGFSILCLSNFIPTIYFGLLTGLAMAIAFLANLTLLPKLIISFKPLGAGKS